MSEIIRTLLQRSIEAGGKMSGFSHRGQISMAARQLGHPLELGVMAGMWQWGRLSNT
jgi:hypothetical protein